MCYNEAYALKWLLLILCTSVELDLKEPMVFQTEDDPGTCARHQQDYSFSNTSVPHRARMEFLFGSPMHMVRESYVSHVQLHS